MTTREYNSAQWSPRHHPIGGHELIMERYLDNAGTSSKTESAPSSSSRPTGAPTFRSSSSSTATTTPATTGSSTRSRTHEGDGEAGDFEIVFVVGKGDDLNTVAVMTQRPGEATQTPRIEAHIVHASSLFDTQWHTIKMDFVAPKGGYGPITGATQLGADIDGEAAGDQAGHAVALNADGTVLVVGAVFNDGGGSNAGHVRVYDWTDGSWVQRGSDIDYTIQNAQFGAAVDVNADGTIVVIGAPWSGKGSHACTSGPGAGGSNGRRPRREGKCRKDLFGYNEGVAISADGTIVAVGGSENSYGPGYVRVYEWSGGSWGQLGADIDGEGTGDYSGTPVRLSSDGTVVAIGAPYNDGGTGSNSGHARVYEWSGSWSQRGSDIDGTSASDYAGYRIALSADGNILALGSQETGGHINVYQWLDGAWAPMGDGISETNSMSVALNADGTVLAAGLEYVQVYEWTAGAWVKAGPQIASEGTSDNFGMGLALNADGSILAAGSAVQRRHRHRRGPRAGLRARRTRGRQDAARPRRD